MLAHSVLALSVLALGACTTSARITGKTSENPGPRAEHDLKVSDPMLLDEDADGRWSPGEAAVLTVTLKNVSGEDFLNYPGALLRTSSDLVGVRGEDWLYMLGAGDAREMHFEVVASADASPGSPVDFQVEGLGLHCDSCEEVGFQDEALCDDCPVSNTLSFVAWIE